MSWRGSIRPAPKPAPARAATGIKPLMLLRLNPGGDLPDAAPPLREEVTRETEVRPGTCTRRLESSACPIPDSGGLWRTGGLLADFWRTLADPGGLLADFWRTGGLLADRVSFPATPREGHNSSGANAIGGVWSL
eukprot:gene13322-biopygen13374